MELPQPGLVVEEFEMRRPARLEKIDDPFRPWRDMRHHGTPRSGRTLGTESVTVEQSGEGRSADHGGVTFEERATVDPVEEGSMSCHGILRSGQAREGLGTTGSGEAIGLLVMALKSSRRG
jgi:hypothetical protein